MVGKYDLIVLIDTIDSLSLSELVLLEKTLLEISSSMNIKYNPPKNNSNGALFVTGIDSKEIKVEIENKIKTFIKNKTTMSNSLGLSIEDRVSRLEKLTEIIFLELKFRSII